MRLRDAVIDERTVGISASPRICLRVRYTKLEERLCWRILNDMCNGCLECYVILNLCYLLIDFSSSVFFHLLLVYFLFLRFLGMFQ